MDFSVIRPKPPSKKPEPPTSKPKAPPHHPHEPTGMPHMGPYMEEFDRVSRIQRLRNIEYTNARTWRMNFCDHHNDDSNYSNYYSDYQYAPMGGGGVDEIYNHRMLPAWPQQQVSLPPPDHRYSLSYPPPQHGYPPLTYHHGAVGPSYYPPPQYYGGGEYFNDEYSNGCMIM